MILAIDPGPRESGWVLLENGPPEPVVEHDHAANAAVLALLQERLGSGRCGALAIELYTPWGARGPNLDGRDTCVWIGRYIQAVAHLRRPILLLERREVCQRLLGTPSAAKTDIRDYLFRVYGPGRQKAVGRKTAPGPLHGLRAHEFDALALALAAYLPDSGRADCG